MMTASDEQRVLQLVEQALSDGFVEGVDAGGGSWASPTRKQLTRLRFWRHGYLRQVRVELRR